MAYSTNSSTYLQTSISFFSFPFTINFWFRPTTIGVINYFPLALHNTTNSQRYAFRIDPSGTLSCITVDGTGTSTATIASPALPIDEWSMATLVVSGGRNRTLYLDGGNATTDGGATRSVDTPTRLLFGGDYTGTVSPSYTGHLAEVAVWNAALNTTELSSLYKTAKTNLIRPQNLRSIYYPLIREVHNFCATHTVVNDNGTKGIAHVRRYG